MTCAIIESVRMTDIQVCSCLSFLSPLLHLWETALVVQNSQYPMRLSGDEVDAGLVVTEWDVLPGNLFPAVLLLHGDHIHHNVRSVCV